MFEIFGGYFSHFKSRTLNGNGFFEEYDGNNQNRRFWEITFLTYYREPESAVFLF